MDHHDTKRILLNEQLAAIQKSFVARMNQELASKRAEKLTLLTDDKAERLTWGLLEIKRSGNKFAITEVGGSLPIGMTIRQWREKFALDLEPKKKRLRIQDDSSDEDEMPVSKPSSKVKEQSKVVQRDSSNGVEVQLREAPSISSSHKSSSLDEIKRQHGFSSKELEEGLNQLNVENRVSSMAACNDELRELYNDQILGGCSRQWKKLQGHNNFDLDDKMQDVSQEFEEKTRRWRLEREQLSRVRTKSATKELYEVSSPFSLASL
jgi:DNA repair photolyase